MIERMFDELERVPAPQRSLRVEPTAWSQYRPDGMLADMLAEAPSIRPPAGRHPEDVGFEILERVGAWDKVIAWAQASQHAEITRFVQHSHAHRPSGVSDEQLRAGAVAEVGLMLRVSRHTADRRVHTATDLVHRLPGVHVALRDGRISLPTARTIAEETTHLPDAEARAVAADVLPTAEERTPGQVRAATRRAVLATDPDAVRTRHEHAVRERGVWLHDEPDGMASLHARLPADQAQGCYAVLDTYARHAQADPDDDRSMDARRADALVDLIHGTTTTRVTTQIRVTVPYTTLLGLDETPAELAGHRPIPADIARRLATDGTWRRILTDPASGALLDYGTTRYTPPPHLREHVITRDRTCTHPGCRIPAHRCDLDHITPFNPNTDTGPTNAENLHPLCRTHHQLKTTPPLAPHPQPRRQHHLDNPHRPHPHHPTTTTLLSTVDDHRWAREEGRRRGGRPTSGLADQSRGSRLLRNVSGGGVPHRCGGTSQSPATQQSSIWSMSENHSIHEPHGSGL